MSTIAQPNSSPSERHAITEQSSAQVETPSLWLYIAGWLVTMSGLYAVNFSMGNPGFSMLSYGLVTCGYVTSYLLRLRNLSLRAVQTPLLVGLALIALAAISSGQGIDWLMPVNDPSDRGKALQLLFVWFAILHSFTLTVDAGVLFTCVPCMTMIALASTQGTETELLNSFLVFVGASTFLMVHENYLRTRQGKVLGRSVVTERRLFGGQIQLAALCVISALLLANFVAVPIREVGQSLSLATNLPQLNSASNPLQQQLSLAVQVTENNELELAKGPETEIDTPMLQVRAVRGLYMRGATFDFYTGRSFKNTLVEELPVGPQPENVDRAERYLQYLDITDGQRSNRRLFRLMQNAFDPLPDEMKESATAEQRVRVVGGRMNNLYGAATPRKVRANFRELRVSPSGVMRTSEVIPYNEDYIVESQVPTDDPETLRRASRLPVPDTIKSRYLQLENTLGPENSRLRVLADSITTGLTNNYDKAMAIQNYVSQRCKYNLGAERAPRDKDIVEYFLTEAKEGYCDSFAAAVTMLCRYAGIPARMASGFMPGDYDERENVYIIRQKHKHVWTEVFFPGAGWAHFDATGDALDVTQRNGTGSNQGGFLGWLLSQRGVTLVIVLICAGLLGYIVKTELWDRWRGTTVVEQAGPVKPATNLAIMAAYGEALRMLSKRGVTRPPHLTPDEFLRDFAARHAAVVPEASLVLERLTSLFYRYRYSDETATEAEAQQAQEATIALKEALQEVRGRTLTPKAAKAPA